MISSVKEFISLCDESESGARHRLRSEEAPLEVWTEIIRTHPELKRVVTLNKTIGQHVIRLLAMDGDPFVRMDVAMLRRLPDDLFNVLANDCDANVRARVAHNAKTPVNILESLAEDSMNMVSEPAKKRIQDLRR